ncbi:MAG: hypothetical protein AAB036_12090 [Elusimicrobiota bacterium]
MIRPDVVHYLRSNLPLYPVEVLRGQLLEEGVPESDIMDSLAQALRMPKTGAPNEELKSKKMFSAALLGAASILMIGGALFFMARSPSRTDRDSTSGKSSELSGFVGHAGWVARLPKDYIGVSSFKDLAKTHQIVYFCKKNTDPTNFLNEGLFGQLGIVKLEVMPTQFTNDPTGLANLSRVAAKKYETRGEKYSMKNIQVATLPGVQVTVLSPFPRVEAFVLGQTQIYFFLAGQEDDVWRDIVLSLRDVHTEN